jgi:hypothetical protein
MSNQVGASQAEQQAVINWFNSKQVKPTCSQCGHDSLNLGRPVMLSPIVQEDGSLDTGHGLGCLPMICNYCAHIEWFFPSNMGPGLEHLGEGS